MAWVCPLCGEINDNDDSWDCADCGKRKPGVPEMDAPPSSKKSAPASGVYTCLRCSGVLKTATLSWGPGKLTVEGDKPDVRDVKVYLFEECGEVAVRAPR